jgi:hypothetical protein
MRRDELGLAGTWALLGTLGVLVALTVPELGSDAWPFRPDRVEPRGVLGPLVRAAGEEWDLGVIRSAAVLAGLLVAAAAAVTLRVGAWARGPAVALALVVVGLLLVPATLLQVGLRDATEPWYHTNDSTYQIELAGDLILAGDNPYGHDYTGSGLERWYPAAGETGWPQVALAHLAYFPGTPLSAAAWRIAPAPFDDYRVLVLLATMGALGAVLLFRAPLAWRLALGAVLAANPLAVKAAWFGTADAPSLLCLLLAFALVTRERYVWAAVALGAAILLKQFALVAVPFLAAMLLVRHVPRETLVRAGAAAAGVVLAGTLPFLVADPGALWDDTIAYGADTYRIIGYGLAGWLLEAGWIDDRYDPYPFAALVALVWLPVTAYLVWTQLRSRTLWVGAAGFAISIFLLLFLGRVLQNSYLVWPLAGIAVSCLLAAGERREPAAGA